MKRISIFAGIVALLSGCAGMNDALTPSARVSKDDFDGTLIVHQPEVSAASSFGEPRHTLGFEWMQRTPGTVYVTVGTLGIRSVRALSFNADGRVIENLAQASRTTEFDKHFSSRRFAMKLDDFVAVAKARSVKMRVGGINDYSVSSFGTETEAIVQTKFAPFLAEVERLRK